MAPSSAPVKFPRVILCRHGETKWSLDGSHTGRTDLPLLPRGEEVAVQLGATFIGLNDAENPNRFTVDPTHVCHIWTSPRVRSRRTLQLLLSHLSEEELANVTQPEIKEDCREWDYGAYEGLKTHEIKAQAGPSWDIWRDGTPDHPTNPDLPGESAQHMSDRIDSVIAQVKHIQQAVIEGHPQTLHDPEVEQRGGDIIIVAHGHYNRCFIARWLGLPLTNGRLFEVDAGGVAILSYAHKNFNEPTIAGIFSSKTGPSIQPQPTLGAHAHEEYQYLNLISKAISSGEPRADRTGTGTLAIYAPQPLKFSLLNGRLPLLTTKRVFWRGVVEELLWFVKGSTDSNILKEKGVGIWDGNGSKEFLESRGLGHRRQGDLGPVYGFQWRHFGAEYGDADSDYTGKGVDQLKSVIETIKKNPTDRRMILSAWNPKDLPLMALPPCHMFAQFYVSLSDSSGKPYPKPHLSCQMYQRSCDLGLGIPFNIASYALLTHMIAHVTGTEADTLTLVMGDAHVYKDHVEGLSEQLTRVPKSFPTLKIGREVQDIDGFTTEDFEVQGYAPHKKIDMKMSV
ncbi:unnamed protein product [Sympodiomycopsis kandeliae]